MVNKRFSKIPVTICPQWKRAGQSGNRAIQIRLENGRQNRDDGGTAVVMYHHLVRIVHHIFIPR